MSSQTIDTTRIQPDGPGAYLVPSCSNEHVSYRVTLHPQHCGCPSFTYRGGPCKHILAVQALYQETPIDLDEADDDLALEAWYAKAQRLDLEDILARTCERMAGKELEESPLGHLLQAWQSEPPWDPYRPCVAPSQLESIGRYVVLQLARSFAQAMGV
jgi:hypothetical protein